MRVAYANDRLDYYLPELEDSRPDVSPAPPLWMHVLSWLLLGVFALPAFLLFRMGNQAAAFLLLAVPYTIICVMNPFIGLCLLFMVSLMDTMAGMGLVSGFFSISKLMAIILGLRFVVGLLGPEGRFRTTTEIKILGVLVFWYLIVVAWSPVALVSAFVALSMLLLSLLLVMIMDMVRTPAHLRCILGYVVLGAVVLCVIARISGPKAGSWTERVAVEGFNSNQFAFTLAFGLFSAIFLLSQSRRFLAKVALIMAITLLLAGIIEAQSRGEYLAVTGALILGVLVSFRERFRQVLLGLIILGLLLFGAFLFATKSGVMPQKAIERLEQPLSRAGESRFNIWRVGMKTGMRRPLRGWGGGSFPYATHTLRDPHNNYLQVFVESGAAGLALWLFALFLISMKAFRLRPRSVCFLATGFIGMVLLAGVTLNTLKSKVAWCEIGIILVIWRLSQAAANQEYTDWSDEEPDAVRAGSDGAFVR